MLTLTIGTFAIALNHLLLISALILATVVGWRVAKRGGERPRLNPSFVILRRAQRDRGTQRRA